jgi:MoxR-like ATPase
MQHPKYQYVKSLLEAGEYVLLEGGAGTGKTTIIMNAAKELRRPFTAIAGSKQTSINDLLGFKSVDGTYIPSTLREVYEHGGVFLIEEIDAMDPNTLICLNSIENGFIAFKDKVVYGHKDFILCATSNPTEEHAAFTGRSKLDASTYDRYHTILIPRDSALEKFITSETAYRLATIAREWLDTNGIASRTITMRDTIRYHKLAILHKSGIIKENPLEAFIGKDTSMKSSLEEYIDTLKYKDIDINETKTVQELYSLIQLKRKGQSYDS